jgi:hypothetical protein
MPPTLPEQDMQVSDAFGPGLVRLPPTLPYHNMQASGAFEGG